MNAQTTVEKGIRQFASGAISLDELRRLFTPLLVQGTVGPGTPDVIATDLINVFEDDSIQIATHQRNAQRLARLSSAGLSDSEYRDFIRLLITQDRLDEIVRKADAGVVSRVGFVAFVGKSRLPDRIKEFLLRASPGELRQFCRSLEEVSVPEIRQFLRY